MQLFLIRHGESWTNVNWRQVTDGAQLNSHLTKKGQNQARKLAAWMKKAVPAVDHLYTSTLHRTMETAVPIESVFGMKAIPDDRLREGGYSYASGEPIPDELLPIYKRVDFHLDPFSPYDTHPEGVESYDQLRGRVGNFLVETIAQHEDETVVVVTHGWTVNAFVDVVFNVPQRRSVMVDAGNTSVTWLTYQPEKPKGPWRLHFLAAMPHLETDDEDVELEVS
jgi:probable phosphoglycerate mutase